MNKFQEWYARNKSLFNQKRKQKYRQNAEFRKTCKTRQRSYLQELEETLIRILPDGRAIEVFRAGQLVKYGITVAQIKELEEGEWIPKSLFTNSPHRYYTPEQVRLICEFYDVVKAGDLEQMKVKSEIVFNQWLEGI